MTVVRWDGTLVLDVQWYAQLMIEFFATLVRLYKASYRAAYARRRSGFESPRLHS